jgi:hypothetical protein
MNWEAFGAIAEMIGGIAVLVTLVYLALQVRQNSVLLEQNTKTARQSILRNQTDRYIANCHFIAGDSGICGIYQRAMKDPSSVTREEWWRFGTYMYGMFKDYEEMFLFASEDQDSAHRWADAQRHIVFYLSPAGGRKWWRSNAKELFAVTFIEFVDDLIGIEANIPRRS